VILGTLSAAQADTEAPRAGNVTDTRVISEASDGRNWLVKGGSFKEQQFSPLKQLNDENVRGLGLAWLTEIDSPMGLTAEPIVVDGVAYLSLPLSIVYAIDAASGKVLWKFDPHVRLDISSSSSHLSRTNRGVAVWQGKVFVSTGDCRLVAIDAASGKELWSSSFCDPKVTGGGDAPRVAGGRVFIGYAGSDSEVRGSVVAFDAQTGKEDWRFWTVPGDPSKGFESKALEVAAKTWSGKEWWLQGGGAVWNALTYDSETGLLLFSTATAHHRGDDMDPSEGAKLFSGSIVAVKADTGEYVWHYQVSRPRVQEENFHILLADLTINGRKRHVAMTVPRLGALYVIDARTGELISKKLLVPDPLHIESGDANPNAKEVPVEGCGDCPTVHNWWPMSFNPVTGLVYLSIIDHGLEPPELPPRPGKLLAWDPATQTLKWAHDQPIEFNSGVLSTAGNLVFEGEGTGEFAAYEANTGRKLWSIHTGSAIDSVPVSYSINGEQYILVPVGWGSACRLMRPSSWTASREARYGPSRLLAFKLGAKMAFPYPTISIPPVPKPPEQFASPERIQHGAALAGRYGCMGCHGTELNGSGAWTLNGAVPDLRYMPEQAHNEWYAIVLGGSHRAQGMMGFGVDEAGKRAMTVSEADDIHAFVIEKSWEAYNAPAVP